MKRWAVRFCLVAIVIGGTLGVANHNWTALPLDARADHIRVEKLARRLTLYREGRVLKTYRIALGAAPVGHKEREGDQRTPEGLYRIASRNSRSSCHLALQVSYPNQADRERAARQRQSPGGDIMIHGLRNGLGWIGAFHCLRDWTAGCIGVTNFEMDEIWRAVPTATPIEIRP